CPGDGDRVAATRAVIDRIDWPCDVRKDYSDVNLGCKRRYMTGLERVFQLVEQAIILEDDCLPHPTFFSFCEELLQRYRDDQRILAIRGSNPSYIQSPTRYSYSFSKYVSTWGWATWRRVWRDLDREMAGWPEFLAGDGMHSAADSPEEQAYYAQV